MKNRFLVAASLAAVAGLGMVLPVWSLQRAGAAGSDGSGLVEAIEAEVINPQPGHPGVINIDTFQSHMMGRHPADHAARSKVTELVNQLRDAEDEAKKAELTKQLEEAITKYFEEDMKVREEELSKLEGRVQKLRAQLERRREAKEEIVDLQVKVLVNEAEGLGFSGLSANPPITIRVPGMNPGGTGLMRARPRPKAAPGQPAPPAVAR